MKTTNLLLLIGGAGVGLYFLTRRRRAPQAPRVIVTGSPVSKPSKEDKWIGFAAGILPGLFQAGASVINTAISQPTVNEAAPPAMKVDYSDVQSPVEETPLWGWDTDTGMLPSSEGTFSSEGQSSLFEESIFGSSPDSWSEDGGVLGGFANSGSLGKASELCGYAGATPPGGLHGFMGSLGAYGGLGGTLYGSH